MSRLFVLRWLCWVGLTAGLANGCGTQADGSAADAGTLPDDTGAGQDTTASPSDPADTHLQPGEWLPQAPGELFGMWANDDGETVRAFHFLHFGAAWQDLIGYTFIYYLYRYPSGAYPVMVQRGTYEFGSGPSLILTPVWADDPLRIGKSLETPFLPDYADQFALEVIPGKNLGRTFVKVPSLP